MAPLALLAADADTPFVGGDWWASHGVALSVSLLIAIVISAASRRWVRRYQRRAKTAGDEPEGRRLRRVGSIAAIVGTTLAVIAWTVFAVTLLSALGVNVGPLVASAGILGVALGFGAQSLVKDTISGLFMFLEGQYDVGDIVDLTASSGTVSGRVESLSLRTTSIRQYDGSLSIVSNGLIEITNNRTRGWGRAVVDVRIALAEDADRVRGVIEELFAQMEGQEPLQGWLREPPIVLGVTDLTDTAQVIRVAAETQPSHRIDAERYLRERIVQRMAERGVRVPPVVPGRAVDPPA